MLQYTASFKAVIFVDGEFGCQSAATGVAFPQQDRSWWIGGDSQFSSKPREGVFTGEVATMHMWAEVLSVDQIQTLAAAVPATVQPALALTAHGAIPGGASSGVGFCSWRNKLWTFGPLRNSITFDVLLKLCMFSFAFRV